MTILFVSLVFGLLGWVIWLAYEISGNSKTPFISFSVITISWVALQAGLALAGYFRNFSALPPPIALVVVPNLVFLIGLALYPFAKRVPGLLKVHVALLIGLQSFRIIMEFILFRLVEDGQLPEILTFTGSNFDILVGLTAPVFAFLAYKYASKQTGKLNRKIYPILKAWNGAGLLILINTAVHGMLSVPTPFQVYQTQTPNTLMGNFPWIWLPGFVVPVALALHILSIKQISAISKQN